jgi:4-hydroxythreonine-4-phosphate dehydrogenase
MKPRSTLLPTIAISMGDPAGIGPEVLVKALADPSLSDLARWVIVGDGAILRHVQETLELRLPESPSVTIVDLGLLTPDDLEVGRVNPKAGAASLEYIRTATRMCLDGRADGMVTGPVSKEAVSLSGQKFTGHTEFIAELCGVSDSRMLLVNQRLAVAHVTTHVSLRQALELDAARILRTIELGRDAMRWLGVPNPRIAVCGINPHAGEQGLFGDEDSRFILPAIRAAQARGIPCEGPLPADTVFLRAVRGAFDLVVAMYHDQGHIPMKLLDFENTVNVSLGLPIFRASVDHGTAFDIAGRNRADPRNMKAALNLAVRMVRERAHQVQGIPGP